jgi:hypothetical protein
VVLKDDVWARLILCDIRKLPRGQNETKEEEEEEAEVEVM